MIYNVIPNSRIKPSVICLGTGSFGSGIKENDSFRLLDVYTDRGGNFVNTANVYGDWVPGEKSLSEKTIGKWLKQSKARDKMIVATKGAHPHLATMHISRVTEKDIVHDIDQSLTHLQTDYIDLYWLHRDDPSKPVYEIMDVLNEQIGKGKIRHIGCSNWTLQRMQEANRYAEAKGLQSFVASQKMGSLATINEDNMSDKSMLTMKEEDWAYHRQTNVAAIPYSSQANGFFSGKYRRDVKPDKQSVYNLYFNAANFEKLDRVAEVALAMSRTQTEIALSYMISQPFPVFPIIGSRNTEQLEESLLAGDLLLDEQTVQYLSTGAR